jgi:hypothetical protein
MEIHFKNEELKLQECLAEYSGAVQSKELILDIILKALASKQNAHFQLARTVSKADGLEICFKNSKAKAFQNIVTAH